MQFAITVVEHRILGYILSAHFLQKDESGEFYTVYDKLTLQKLEAYKDILAPEQVQLVKYIENYSEQNLYKLFYKKKKLTSHDFMNSIEGELLSEHIRPYTEKQIFHCAEFMPYNPAPIFYKHVKNKVYESDRIEFVSTECDTIFNFTRYEEGIKYWLNIEYQGKELNLTGREHIILSDSPCCIVVNKKMFLFKNIDSKKLLPFFNKEYVLIPHQTEKKYFETFIKKTLAQHKVKAKGFTVNQLEEEPKAIITLERNLEGDLSLVLKFIYAHKSIYYANRTSGVKVDLSYSESEVSFSVISRNYEFENSMISKLLSIGLVNKEGPYFEVFNKKLKNDKIYGAITWLNFNKELLIEKGFEVAQKNLDKNYYLNAFEIKFDVSDKENDWFDIKATVKFEGFEIPFANFSGHISGGIREFVLPDNKVMILPEEWFESYSDLLSFSKVEDNLLKLNKQHFSILNNKVGKISDKFKENLKSLLAGGDVEAEACPEEVKANLRNYQSEGFSWMYHLYINGFGGCLADDMGLGKTLQTITLLTKVGAENQLEDSTENIKEDIQLDIFDSLQPKLVSKTTRTSLIVVPTSLIHNWVNEFRKFAPGQKVLTYAGAQREELDKVVKKANIVVTSYGLIRNDIEKFKKHKFSYLVLDESQTIKNPGSKTYASVVQLNADNRLVLSGTPIENSLTDLWAQFNFVNPGLLGSLRFFQDMFQVPIEKHGDASKQEKLQQLIAPFILRRTKQQVAKELPELEEQVVVCSMNDAQKMVYEREKSKARNLVLENMQEKGRNKASMLILQSLTKLRQIANHPVLTDNDYVMGSGKLDEVKHHMENLHSEGHKALIFSSFVGHLKLVSDWLDEQKIKYVVLTGETRDREKVVNEFQDNEDCRFFLISLKAGGVGLNLTAASYVLMLDPWWNPAAEKQAINRAHRIGQNKNVMVYRFVSEETLEEKIIKLQEKKSELAEIFVHENSLKNFTEEEIMELFE